MQDEDIKVGDRVIVLDRADTYTYYGNWATSSNFYERNTDNKINIIPTFRDGKLDGFKAYRNGELAGFRSVELVEKYFQEGFWSDKPFN